MTMGFAVLVIVVFAATLIAEILLVALIGTAGLYLGSVVLAVAVARETLKWLNNRDGARATAVLVSGLSILVPLVFAAATVKETRLGFLNWLLNSLRESNTGEGIVLLLFFLFMLWVVGGALLVINHFGDLADGQVALTGDQLVGKSVLIVLWGLTASPVVGWLLAGLPYALFTGA